MDKSIYEKDHYRRQQLDSSICFGRVTSVDINSRMLTVKTFFGRGTDDMHIKNCQWLSIDSHPDGDESTAIPRRGAFGLVFMVGGEPFFLGGVTPLNKFGQAKTGDEAEEKLLEGDKVIGTAAGNRIVVKVNKVIDMISDITLRRTMFPKNKLISDICANYNLTTDGGRIRWENSGAPLNLTKYSVEYANSVNRGMVVFDQYGFVSSDIIYQRDIGPGIPTLPGTKIPVYTETIGIDGTYKRGVGPAGEIFKQTINPDGSVELSNLATKITVSPTGTLSYKNQTTTLEIKDTGDVSLANPMVTVEAKATGDYSVANPTTSIKATASGDMTLEASQAKAVFGKGKFELSGPAGGLMENLSKSLQELIDLTTAMQTEVHVGNMGYPTAPPTNAAQYAKAMTALTGIKTVVDILKA